MVRQLFLTVGLILIATSAFGQDPQAVMNMLLQRQMERYQLQQQLERQELEENFDLGKPPMKRCGGDCYNIPRPPGKRRPARTAW